MSFKLKSTGLFRQTSLVVQDDHLLHLEHDTGKDRIRKVFFNRIASVTLWREIPTARIVLSILIFGIPGIILFFSASSLAGEGVAIFITVGGVFLLISLISLFWHLVAKRTVIRIVRGDEVKVFKVVVSQTKVTRFMDELIANIHRVQEEAIARAERESIESYAPPEEPTHGIPEEPVPHASEEFPDELPPSTE